MFDTQDKVVSGIIGDGGTLSQRTKEFTLDHGKMDITADLFDEDALIIENNQAHKVSLCNQDIFYCIIHKGNQDQAHRSGL